MEPPDQVVLGGAPLRRQRPPRLTLELGPPGPAAARLAGIVIAGAYSFGIVDGPIVAAVGGLALVTFGRALLVDGHGPLVAAAGLGILAAAIGVAAIRWGTLEVAELRGVQAALGPTVATGTSAVVGWAITAAVAGLVALLLWTAVEPAGATLWGIVEGSVFAATLVTPLAGVRLPTTAPGTAALVVLAVVVAAASRRPARVVSASPRVAAVAGALAALGTGAAAIGVALAV